jgi:uncharacterized protein (TIGR00725 family)
MRHSRTCVAVVGPGNGAERTACDDAAAIGRLLAEHGFVTLTGGSASGVMGAAAAGARSGGGLAIGLLRGLDRDDAASGLSVALPTGLGEARNAVLVASADAVIACGSSPGTASEIALALRARKPTILVRPSATTRAFFEQLSGGARLHSAATPDDALRLLLLELGESRTDRQR